MNKIIKRNLIAFTVSILTCITLFAIFSNKSLASFADYDDETADAQTKNELQEQQKNDIESAGKSSNNYLSELTVKGYALSPNFEKQTINYSIDTEIVEDTIEITAVADDSRATIAGAGSIKLQSGENNISLEVTAENGTSRTYFIKVNAKTEKEEQTNNEQINTTDMNVQNNELVTNKESNLNSFSITNNKKTIIIIVLVALAVLIIIWICKKHKSKH